MGEAEAASGHLRDLLTTDEQDAPPPKRDLTAARPDSGATELEAVHTAFLRNPPESPTGLTHDASDTPSARHAYDQRPLSDPPKTMETETTNPAGPAGDHQAAERPQATSQAHELLVRHARKGGRPVAVLRLLDHGSECVVETEVYPPNATTAVRTGPYTFVSSQLATTFVTDAVEALMYLGCDVQAA